MRRLFPKDYARVGWLAAGSLALVIFVRGVTRPRKRKATAKKVLGRVVCPGDIGYVPDLAAPSGRKLQEGDYVSLRLATLDGSYSEPAWAIVVQMTELGMTVELTGGLGTATITPPTDVQHGYRIGSRITIPTTCIFAWLPTQTQWMALCGYYAEEVGAPEPIEGPVVAGQDVLVYLAEVKGGSRLEPGPGWNVATARPGRVSLVAANGSIAYVDVLGEAPPGLELPLAVTRDCIFPLKE